MQSADRNGLFWNVIFLPIMKVNKCDVSQSDSAAAGVYTASSGEEATSIDLRLGEISLSIPNYQEGKTKCCLLNQSKSTKNKAQVKSGLDQSAKMFSQANSHFHESDVVKVGRIILKGEQVAQQKFHRIDNEVLLFSLHRYLASQKLNVYGVVKDSSFHPKTDIRWITSQKDQPFPVDCNVDLDSYTGLEHPSAYIAYDKEDQVQYSTDIYWNQNPQEVTHSFLKDYSPVQIIVPALLAEWRCPVLHTSLVCAHTPGAGIISSCHWKENKRFTRKRNVTGGCSSHSSAVVFNYNSIFFILPMFSSVQQLWHFWVKQALKQQKHSSSVIETIKTSWFNQACWS